MLSTFILVSAIIFILRNKPDAVPLSVGFIVGGTFLATSSTMFANPAVTIARVFTFTIAGIRPLDDMIFIIVQVFAALIAVLFCRTAYPAKSEE